MLTSFAMPVQAQALVWHIQTCNSNSKMIVPDDSANGLWGPTEYNPK